MNSNGILPPYTAVATEKLNGMLRTDSQASNGTDEIYMDASDGIQESISGAQDEVAANMNGEPLSAARLANHVKIQSSDSTRKTAILQQHAAELGRTRPSTPP